MKHTSSHVTFRPQHHTVRSAFRLRAAFFKAAGTSINHIVKLFVIKAILVFISFSLSTPWGVLMEEVFNVRNSFGAICPKRSYAQHFVQIFTRQNHTNKPKPSFIVSFRHAIFHDAGYS